MKKAIPYIVLTLLIFMGRVGFAQNFKMLKTFGTKSGFDRIERVSAEPNGGCSFLFAYVTSGTKPDTLNLGSYQYIKNPTYQSANFLVRLDSSGKILKIRLISQGKDLNNMCRDNQGNFYIAGQISGAGVFDGTSLSAANGNLVYAKYDNDLNRVWLTQTGYSANPYDLFFSQGHLLFTCRASSGTTTIGPKTFKFNTTNFVYGEINQATGIISWCNYLYASSSAADYLHITGIQYLKNNIFISGMCSRDINLDSGGLQKGGFIVRTDTVGKYKQSISIQNKKYSGFSCLTTDGEFLYTSGNNLDSFILGGKKIYSPNSEFVVASFTPSLQLRWFYQPKVLDKTKPTGGPVIASTNEGYIYFGGILKTKVEMAGNTITPAGAKDVFLFKMDYLGNVLWATNGGTTGEMFGLDAIAGKYVYAGGYFENKIKFGIYSDSSKGETDGWLTKILDNSIYRGNINKGPYCAGDTIKIPYTKFGEFDTLNYFIAELSDEKGNFETGYTELGRIKSNKDGIVIGKLPSIHVKSSNKYCIRIRSTYPQLQSFYRLDTLNLLIYSSDKANPGPPETICLGDTIKLNTVGGTKWTWSPTGSMNNASLQQPKVWPKTTTTYKIIIADSSGCGKPDTAFKKIIVRKPLKIKLGYSDTMVCNNSKLNIPLNLTGGDSTNYNWKFFSMLHSGSGKLKNPDTIFYLPKVTKTFSEKLTIILNDGCTLKPDTAFVTISLRKQIVLKKLRDTAVCVGEKLNLTAGTSGGVSKYYQFQWKNLTDNKIVSTQNTFSYSTSKPVKIQLTLNDGCINFGDTTAFVINLKPPVKATTNLIDTALCFGNNLNFMANGKGGDSLHYNFNWLLNNKPISATNNLVFKTEDYFSNSSSVNSLALVLTDNCSLPNDTIKKTITVKSTPKADFTYDFACSKTITKFLFTGTQPKYPITTLFKWNFNTKDSSTLENPSYQFTSLGTSTVGLTLTSSNGCTNTIKNSIDVKPQSKADFTTKDVCESDSAIFINKSEDATGYTWKFGDGLKSSIGNPKHKYQIGGISTTYNVTLVALVKKGCADSVIKVVTINQNPNSDFSYTKTGNKLDLKAKESGNAQYHWKFGKTDSVTTTTPTYSYTNILNQSTVCLSITNISGCHSQTCKNVSLGISNLSKNNNFKLYPNPNSGSFNIEIENPSKNISIEIYDLTGNMIKAEDLSNLKSSNPVNINPNGDIANGIYLVKIKNGETVSNQKMLIEKGINLKK